MTLVIETVSPCGHSAPTEYLFFAFSGVALLQVCAVIPLLHQQVNSSPVHAEIMYCTCCTGYVMLVGAH